MKPTLGKRMIVALTLLGLLTFARWSSAGEWPQILGPNRDARAVDEPLAESWPAAGPKLVWKFPVGSGYAGVAVQGGRVIVYHRQQNETIAEALDARSGKSLWQAKFPTAYQTSIAPDDGPRCVPLVHADRVYLYGADGDLHCVDFKSGKVVWSRDAASELKAPLGYFGAGSTPLVAGDKLLVNIGAPGADVVAFALKDGKPVWKAGNDTASYSSPTLGKLDGREQAIFVTRLKCYGFDPANGEVCFEFPFGARGPTVNAATPLLLGDDLLFVTASYGVGGRTVRVKGGKPEIVWQGDSVMSSQYTTPVLHDGVLYGIDGRQDAGVAKLRAVDPRAGKVLWTQEGFGAGNLILAGDKLLVMKIDGAAELVKVSPDGYHSLAKAKLFETTVQPLPALAGGMLYVRDTQTLKCFEVGQHP